MFIQHGKVKIEENTWVKESHRTVRLAKRCTIAMGLQ